MKRITKETLAAEAAKSWKLVCHTVQYGWISKWNEDVYNKLLKLGANPNPDDVDTAIGSDYYTRIPYCTACGVWNKTSVVEFGEYSDTAHLCEECAERVYRMFRPKQTSCAKNSVSIQHTSCPTCGCSAGRSVMECESILDGSEIYVQCDECGRILYTESE